MPGKVGRPLKPKPTRVLKLRSGGEVHLTFLGNLFDCQGDERVLLLAITDAVMKYESGSPAPSSPQS